MIEVELQSVPEGAVEYATVARVTVPDQGPPEIWDPQGVVPTYLPALDQTPEGLERVSFEADPARWARCLGSILRTGYLVPVVVRDDGGNA